MACAGRQASPERAHTAYGDLIRAWVEAVLLGGCVGGGQKESAQQGPPLSRVGSGVTFRGGRCPGLWVGDGAQLASVPSGHMAPGSSL